MTMAGALHDCSPLILAWRKGLGASFPAEPQWGRCSLQEEKEVESSLLDPLGRDLLHIFCWFGCCLSDKGGCECQRGGGTPEQRGGCAYLSEGIGTLAVC